MVTFQQVKKDLKNLKHIEYLIQSFAKAQEKLQKQYQTYESNGQATPQELEKLKDSIKRLDASGSIKKSIEKKEKYFKAISQLDPINQTIIIESVINGATYWQIAHKLNYSEIAIKKKVNQSVGQIVELLNAL